MNTIKSFAAACKAVGTTEAEFNAAFAQLPEKFSKAKAHEKLAIIVEALNEEWKPDWKNTDQPKYFPWIDMEDFSLDYVGYYDQPSSVSSRLCFKSGDLAEYAFKQFKPMYKQYFIG